MRTAPALTSWDERINNLQTGVRVEYTSSSAMKGEMEHLNTIMTGTLREVNCAYEEALEVLRQNMAEVKTEVTRLTRPEDSGRTSASVGKKDGKRAITDLKGFDGLKTLRWGSDPVERLALQGHGMACSG